MRGRESLFLTKLEQSIRVLAPETTQLVDDVSSGYRASLLYLDTHYRSPLPYSTEKLSNTSYFTFGRR